MLEERLNYLYNPSVENYITEFCHMRRQRAGPIKIGTSYIQVHQILIFKICFYFVMLVISTSFKKKS